MASRNYTVGKVIDVLDAWNDSDAEGMSSSEEAELDKQLLGLDRSEDGSSRQVLFVFS